MVGQETQCKNGWYQESLYDDPLFATLCLGVTITHGHSPEFLSDLHIKTKKGYIKNKEEHHCCQVYDPTDKSFAVEVEANLVTRMFLTVAWKQGHRSWNEDHPDDVACCVAPLCLLDSKDPNRLDDFQISIQTDEAEEQDAGIHVDVEKDAHHLAQIEGTFFVVVVNSQGQTHDQEGVRQGKVPHVHGHGRVCMPLKEKYVEGDGVTEQTNATDENVADGQEGPQYAIMNLTGLIGG